MRRTVVIAVMLGLLSCGALTTSASAEQFTIAPAGTPKFPQRSFRLTVPTSQHLGAANLRVTENGNPVRRLTLTSADAARGGEFGTVLVIDASKSMHGAAIRGAINAAREVASRRTGAQQLGVVVFNRNPKVLLVPTDDQRLIDEALSTTPRLGAQTHIFDAVNTAMDLLKQASISAGSIVVLSDGSDTGSKLAASAVSKRARDANIAIYTVGLHSRAFDSGELKGLARAGRGRYAEAASVSDLRRIFSDLGTQLATDYLLEYRSFANPGRSVTVAVRADGIDGIASTTYTAPGGSTFVEVKDVFWTSTLGVLVTAALSTMLLAFSLGILLMRRRRAPTLRQRVQSFVSAPGDPTFDRRTVLAPVPVGATERSLARLRWWPAFKRDVEIARIEIDPVAIVVTTIIATLVVMWLLVLITGLPLFGLFAIGIPLGVRTWVRVKRDRERAKFVDQLPDLLQGAASAIRAGHGFVAALSIVSENAPEPVRTEITRVVADEALGIPLDDALRVVQERMDSREVMQIALVAEVQREAGGNMAEVLDRITDALRQRGELKRMVRGLTAQGRLSRWVVTALPIFLLLAISVTGPRYVHPLFTTGLGIGFLAMAAVLSAIGSAVIGKIVNFKV